MPACSAEQASRSHEAHRVGAAAPCGISRTVKRHSTTRGLVRAVVDATRGLRAWTIVRARGRAAVSAQGGTSARITSMSLLLSSRPVGRGTMQRDVARHAQHPSALAAPPLTRSRPSSTSARTTAPPPPAHLPPNRPALPLLPHPLAAPTKEPNLTMAGRILPSPEPAKLRPTSSELPPTSRAYSDHTSAVLGPGFGPRLEVGASLTDARPPDRRIAGPGAREPPHHPPANAPACTLAPAGPPARRTARPPWTDAHRTTAPPARRGVGR